MRAFYERLPTADELRGTGFTPEDYIGDDAEVWPENWPSWTLFMDVHSQWNIGMAGPTSLMYGSLYPLLDRRSSSRDEWEDLFADIRVLEAEALAAMNKKT